METSTGKGKAPIEKVLFQVEFFLYENLNLLRKVTDWGGLREKKVKVRILLSMGI